MLYARYIQFWKREKKIAFGLILFEIFDEQNVCKNSAIHKGDTKFELVKNDLLSIVIQNNTPRLSVQLLTENLPVKTKNKTEASALNMRTQR